MLMCTAEHAAIAPPGAADSMHENRGLGDAETCTTVFLGIAMPIQPPSAIASKNS